MNTIRFYFNYRFSIKYYNIQISVLPGGRLIGYGRLLNFSGLSGAFIRIIRVLEYWSYTLFVDLKNGCRTWTPLSIDQYPWPAKFMCPASFNLLDVFCESRPIVKCDT